MFAYYTSQVPLAKRFPFRYTVAVIPLIDRVSALLPIVAVTLPFTDLKLVGRTDEILYDCTEKP